MNTDQLAPEEEEHQGKIEDLSAEIRATKTRIDDLYKEIEDADARVRQAETDVSVLILERKNEKQKLQEMENNLVDLLNTKK